MTDLYPRWQQGAIEQGLRIRRILLVNGPRQSGKTTLVRDLLATGTEYRTLDDLTLREAADNDPHGFVKSRSGTLIIDEVQRAPNLLPAIKKVVDEDNRPGQYLLTGSANIQSLPGVQESLAGRAARISLRTLAQGEQQRQSPAFLERVLAHSFDARYESLDRDDLLDRALRGGFPEAITLQQRDRVRWHRDYIAALLERDLQDMARIRRQDAMRELVTTLAAWSGKFIDITAIGAGLSIRRPTIESYLNALEALHLVERVRPWGQTDYARAGKQSKLFMTDCGLMASILGWQAEQIRWDSDRCGKLMETFAFNELAAQVDANDGECQLYHYRDREKREIDFIVVRADGTMLGIEVKAGSSVSRADFRHLTWFQKRLTGNRDFTGILLYAGGRVVSFGQGLWAVPFSYLWAA